MAGSPRIPFSSSEVIDLRRVSRARPCSAAPAPASPTAAARPLLPPGRRHPVLVQTITKHPEVRPCTSPWSVDDVAEGAPFPPALVHRSHQLATPVVRPAASVSLDS
jgi:hypothetical protein